LQNIDLAIASGEYLAVIGANGSGKSTLARHLNGLLLPGSGQVIVNGCDTRDEASLSAIRQQVQMIFQEPDAQIIATVVEEDIAFGPENFGVPPDEINRRVEEALKLVDLWELRRRPPHMLSAGQKQRVAIAGALAVHPSTLVLDEATAMLDPHGRDGVLQLLEVLHQQGVTVITITHEMDEAARAERVVVLSEGQIVLQGTPQQVFSQDRVLAEVGLELPLITAVAKHLGLPACLTADELIEQLGTPPLQAMFQEAPPLPQPGAMDTALIQVTGLSHRYLRDTPFETTALTDIDVEIGAGTAAGLVGHTGSGKSTLMQHLNGLMRPQKGQVRVGPYEWADPNVDVVAARRLVGLLFQQPEDQLF
jgi:energy-coupling factor transport system ATP-binding protein